MGERSPSQKRRTDITLHGHAVVGKVGKRVGGRHFGDEPLPRLTSRRPTREPGNPREPGLASRVERVDEPGEGEVRVSSHDVVDVGGAETRVFVLRREVPTPDDRDVRM